MYYQKHKDFLVFLEHIIKTITMGLKVKKNQDKVTEGERAADEICGNFLKAEDGMDEYLVFWEDESELYM